MGVSVKPPLDAEEAGGDLKVVNQWRTAGPLVVTQVDALRALALSGIFMHHLWHGDGNGALADRFVSVVCYVGQFGVIFFNFITGFVLSLPYLSPEGRPAPGYPRFMRRRFFRIVPPYYLALIVIAAGNILVFGVGFPDALRRLAERLFFLQGLDPSSMQTNTAALWYLTMLAEFYLLFPLLLRLFIRIKPWRACLLSCVICWGALGVASALESRGFHVPWGQESMVYFNLPARLPEFAMGMWLAAAWRPGKSPGRSLPADERFLAFGLAMLVFALAGAAWSADFPQPLSLMYQVACCLVVFLSIFFLREAARLGKLGAVKNVSIASYGIYLVHQPLFSYAEGWFGKGMDPAMKFAIMLVVLGPLTYLLSRGLDALAGPITSAGSKLMDTKSSGMK